MNLLEMLKYGYMSPQERVLIDNLSEKNIDLSLDDRDKNQLDGLMSLRNFGSDDFPKSYNSDGSLMDVDQLRRVMWDKRQAIDSYTDSANNLLGQQGLIPSNQMPAMIKEADDLGKSEYRRSLNENREYMLEEEDEPKIMPNLLDMGKERRGWI